MTRGLIYKKYKSAAEDLGVDSPKALTNCVAAGTGGSTEGTYYVGMRWLTAELQPGSLSVLTTVSATASDAFRYGSTGTTNRFQDAVSTRISASHKGYVQLWRSNLGDSSIVYTVYGTGTAMTVSATENDEGYSKYTISDIGGVSPVTALIPGDVVVLSGHTVANQDGQQTILKVLIDDKKIVTDKGFFGAGTGTATERLFYMSYKGDLTSHADSGGQAKFTTATKHKLAVGAVILVAGSHSDVSGTYDAVHTVLSVQSPFVFTSSVAFDAGTLGTPTYQLIGAGSASIEYDQLTDAQLTASSNISMAITARDSQLVARRQNPPPKHKSVVTFFRSRMWYAVDVAYGGSNHAGTAMTVAVTNGDRTITGTSTDFRSDMIGRLIYIEGETIPHEIQSITSTTVLEVDTAVARTTTSGLEFKICPKPEERNKIYYCVDDATDILTKRGWLRREQLKVGDIALTINPATRQIEWQKVTHKNEFDYNGELNRWKSSKFDALTTDDHRWLADGCGVMGGHWSLRSKQGLGSASHFTATAVAQDMTSKRLIVGGGTPVVNDIVDPVSDDIVELAGWYVTEGTDSKCKPGLVVSQSESHNPRYCDRINGLAERLRVAGGTATLIKRNAGTSTRQWYFGGQCGLEVKRLCPDRQLTPEFLCRLNHRQLVLLYKTIMDADGHRHKGRNGSKVTDIFSQKDRQRTESFQMLAAMIGKRSSYRTYHIARYGYDMHSSTAYSSPRATVCKLTRTKEHYEGKVWCPTTANGTWMARRNGFTYWTGNSEPDEPESVPATNVVYLEENTNDNDVIVGLAPHGAVLYAFKERHTYRISFGRQPKIDADPTLAFSRGALNHRCIAVFEDSAYVIDYAGIYSVSLWGSDQLARNGIDHDIKPLLDFVYDGKLGLDQARNAFTVVDPERRQVRFFLATSSLAPDYSYDTTLLRPKACLVYNIDTKTWDVEGYVQQFGGGCCAPVSGRMRVFMAGMKDRVYSMKDNVAESGVVHNSLVTTYTSGTPSLTDSDASFGVDGELVNAPVAIIDGTGKFEVRRVASHDNTVLTLDKAFDTELDATSEYLVGGVMAKFKTGAFAFPDSFNSKGGEKGNKRGMRIAYQPFSDTFDIRFYLNHQTTPYAQKISISEGMGITTTADSSNIVVDATRTRSRLENAPGYCVIEIGGGRLQGESYGNRWLAVELRCFRGLAKPKFYGMEIMGVIPHPGSGEK